MSRARKKPVEISFMTYDEVFSELARQDTQPDCKEGNINGHTVMWYDKLYGRYNIITIETLEGKMEMTSKDVLIIGIQGEIYPCKIDIFNETYEVIE